MVLVRVWVCRLKTIFERKEDDMKNIFSFFAGEKMKGSSWDPNSILGLGDWDANYREVKTPVINMKGPRGVPHTSLPLAMRLAKVHADLKDLEKALPNLKKLKS